MTRGLARRTGAVLCVSGIATLALGATASASFADHRDHPAKQGKHSSHPHARQDVPRHVTTASVVANHHAAKTHAANTRATKTHAAKPRNARAAQPAIPSDRPAIPAAKRPHVTGKTIKLTDVLLPDLLGQTGSSTTTTKRASVLLGARLTPAVVTPAVVTHTVTPSVTHTVTPPVTATVTVPRVAVPSVLVRQVPRAVAPAAAVNAQSLLNISPVRQVSRSLGVQGISTLHAAARPARHLAVQAVSRELPRIGQWPSGPSALINTGADLPLSVALGGLVLALAAARGVAQMRHQRSEDDAELTFASS